jgi:hypothetical protein
MEHFLSKAKRQVSQRDINESLTRALDALGREMKRIDDALQRAHRDIRIARRL